MINPSISFDDSQVSPLWVHLSLEDVQGFLRVDVAELHRYLKLQAEDLESARVTNRQPDYRIRTFIKAWEIAQDAHWSWYKEILNDRTHTSDRPEGLGSESVGQGNC